MNRRVVAKELVGLAKKLMAAKSVVIGRASVRWMGDGLRVEGMMASFEKESFDEMSDWVKKMGGKMEVNEMGGDFYFRFNL